MYLGNLILALTFASCILALSGYVLGASGRVGYLSLGRRSYYVFVALTIVLSSVFVSQILSHNFQIEYVHDYSSTDLSFFLLLSTFWAGQVGTFILWLLFVAIVGLFLYRRSDPMSPLVMTYYILGAVFLLVLLSVSAPFRLLPFVPEEGRGLNPLLQNFWMVIHPPIVFVGYTLMAVPFAFAMSALTKNDYSSWMRHALPWTLMSSAVLGLGIFLGGYWAYETLGWGGYWGWDPVENASLVPWLTNLALLHGLLVERKYGQLRKTNLFLASIGFLLIIYGTFLTRSGVLADFSVHSFTDLGLNAFLILFLFGFLGAVIVLSIWRFPRLKPEKKTEDPWSADFMMSIGLVVTTLFSVLVLIGTSSPLITRLPFFDATANVSLNYYYRIALPIGILMALLAGLTQFLQRKDSSVKAVLIASLPSLFAGAISLVVAGSLGVQKTGHLLVVFFAVYALVANLQVLLLTPAGRGVKLGGHLSHIGLGIILIGFLISTAFATSEKVALRLDEPKDAMGYTFTYGGMRGDVVQKDNAVLVEIKDGESVFTADPKLYLDSYTRSMMKTPYIESFLLYDLYLAPEEVATRPPGEVISVEKGDSSSYDGWTVEFEKFDLSSHGESSAMQVGAVLHLRNSTDSISVVPVLAIQQGGQRDREPVPVEGTDLVVTLEDVHPDTRVADIRFSREGETATELLVLEVSHKPLMQMVWLGAIVIVVGAFISFYHRYRLSLSR